MKQTCLATERTCPHMTLQALTRACMHTRTRTHRHAHTQAHAHATLWGPANSPAPAATHQSSLSAPAHPLGPSSVGACRPPIDLQAHPPRLPSSCCQPPTLPLLSRPGGAALGGMRWSGGWPTIAAAHPPPARGACMHKHPG